MVDKIELYNGILNKYNFEAYDGVHLSMDDIKFDFKTETVFIKKYHDCYVLFIEENNFLYAFWLKFFHYNKKNYTDFTIRKEEKDGSINYLPNYVEENKFQINKFNFIKEDLNYIIGQIKSERLFLLLYGKQNSF